MEELEKMLDELKVCLAKKTLEMNECENPSAYTGGLLLNCKRAIEGFELGSKSYSKDPFLKKEIINNFSKKAAEIKTDIDKITC